MNVTCDTCGKKYVISDDKVVGKSSVKIRCKQCQSLITITVASGLTAPVAAQVVVQPQVAAPPSAAPLEKNPWEEESTRAMPPLDATVQWFAMLGGKQQGPFDLGELHRRVGANEVTLRTYLWKSGMDGWKRAADVPEVSPIFAGVSMAPPPLQRDVAVANEVPSSTVSKPTAQNGAGAVVQHQPLNDLFGDVNEAAAEPSGDLGSLSPAADSQMTNPDLGAPLHEPAGEAAQGEEPVDPFAAITGPEDGKSPAPGEATRFFIAQAGVHKRNPPWKIALFVMLFIGGPLGLVYILNTFEIVKLPGITRTDENGEEVQESFFSAGGAAGLKDILTGDAKKKKLEAERLRKEREAIARARTNGSIGGGTRPSRTDEPQTVTPKAQDPNLAAFYEQDDRKTRLPKVRELEGNAGQPSVNTSGLSAESVGKVVADKAKAFQTCIDNALRRNPNLSVGNVTVVLTVGPSGAVRGTGVEPKKYEISDWGQCMMTTGKRIVFPSSDGETQVELPFKVGVAL